MKNLTIILLIISLSIFSFSKPICGSKTIEIDNNDTINISIKCFRDGTIYEFRECHGKLHGKNHTYYPNGNVRQISYFNHGLEYGVRTGWYLDGSIAYQEPYFNNLPVDTHKAWYENKKQESIIVYDSTGEKNGWCRNWYENGNLKDSTLFTHGAKLQEFLFYENGKRMFTSTLKEDGYILSATSWFPDGKQNGEIKNGNGKVITPRSIPDAYDTLVVKDGKVQNSSFHMFHDQ